MSHNQRHKRIFADSEYENQQNTDRESGHHICVYRIEGDRELKGCLACQTKVEDKMYVATLPFFPLVKQVYEEETPNVFEDRSDEILEHSTTARLLSFPNVMITSHQGFFTEEALEAIAKTTLGNAGVFERKEETTNEVK